MQNRWIRYTVVIAGWLFLGLVLAIEVYFNNRASMPSAPIDFIEVAIPQFGRAAMWALMAPLILRLREKVPLSAERWIGGTAFHFGMSFVVMATYYLGRMLSYRILDSDPGSTEPF